MKSPLIELPLSDFTMYKDLISAQSGIEIHEEMDYFVESQLRDVLTETGCKNYKELYHQIKTDTSKQLLITIVNALTMYDSSWFDRESIWRALKEILLPQYIDWLRSGKKEKIVIWCMASSTGQEPYSVAMLVEDAVYKEPKIRKEQFQIIATDISPSALYMTVSGRYPDYQMTPGYIANYKEQFFDLNAGIYEIKPDIRKMISIIQFDLHDNFSKIPKCDLILCRNIVPYLKPSYIDTFYKKIFDQLLPNGHLFLGDRESINDYSIGFVMLEEKIFHKSG